MAPFIYDRKHKEKKYCFGKKNKKMEESKKTHKTNLGDAKDVVNRHIRKNDVQKKDKRKKIMDKLRKDEAIVLPGT